MSELESAVAQNSTSSVLSRCSAAAKAELPAVQALAAHFCCTEQRLRSKSCWRLCIIAGI